MWDETETHNQFEHIRVYNRNLMYMYLHICIPEEGSYTVVWEYFGMKEFSSEANYDKN